MTKDKFDFTPFGGWVILPNPSKRKTDAGIILDDATAKQLQTNILEVLAVGPDCRQTKIGDTVMVDPNSEAMLIHINDVQYLFVNEFQILGKF
jgi:co-chaperonin GroES (HSP10)|tara:strand:- start:2459 stop:2737 length:279 start_codon:yes stop_codon:yes gene_type:complete